MTMDGFPTHGSATEEQWVDIVGADLGRAADGVISALEGFLRVVPHSIRPDEQIGEILIDGVFVASLYRTIMPGALGAIKIVSAHFENPAFIFDDGKNSMPPIPAMYLAFTPRPYSIVGNEIKREP